MSHECHVYFFFLLIELACDPTRTADVAAVIMHEGKCQVGSRLYREEDDVSYYSVMFVCVCTGLAHVCVVTPCMTITRARIEMSIPRKRKGSCANHDKVFSTVPPGATLPLLSSLFSPLPPLPPSPLHISSPFFSPHRYISDQLPCSLTVLICRHFKGFTKQLCKLF